MNINPAEIESVLTGIVSSGNQELQKMSREELEDYWFFQWDDSATLERNLYEFHDMLKLYGSFCRRWEEMHKGTCCVVERVRDTYLMPKIREFADRVLATRSQPVAADGWADCVLVAVKRPEDYEGVDAQLVAEDFAQNPGAFAWRVVDGSQPEGEARPDTGGVR